MAKIPSLETILLEVHESLGCKAPDQKKQRIIDLKQPLKTHMQVSQKLIEDVFTALDMDGLAAYKAAEHFFNIAGFNNTLEQHVCTYDADLRQVVWYMAGYAYAPSLGRALGLESLEQSFDKGMPGGSFWYLPEIRAVGSHNELVMPVTQVVDWLLELLDQPIKDIAKTLGGGVDPNDGFSMKVGTDFEGMKRTFYNWRNGVAPQVDHIERYFPDDSALVFMGALNIDPQGSDENKFTTVIEYIKKKCLNAKLLADQIPMSESRIESVLSGDAEDTRFFIDLMSDRYGVPSPKTIRLRLRVASASQDGYTKLCKLLLGKDFDSSCPDLGLNKVLQLFEIFKFSYNLTIEASKHSDDERAQDAYYENKIPPSDRQGIFLSILPSKKETSYLELALKLSEIFKALKPNGVLEDHVAYDQPSAQRIGERNRQRRAPDELADQKFKSVIQELVYRPHWQVIMPITCLKLLNRIALDLTLPLETRQIALVRMNELAISPQDKVLAIQLELSQLLDGDDRKIRAQDAQVRVSQLLDAAKNCAPSEFNRIVILYYQAKHHIASNEFEYAQVCLTEVLKKCLKYGFGKVYGEVARDTFALIVERQTSFYLENNEKYYRIMLAYGGLPNRESDTPPSLEDVACFVSDYFWKELYHPYDGVKVATPIVMEEEQLRRDTMPLIEAGDWTALKAWFNTYPFLRNKPLKGVRSDTALMMWIKIRFELISPTTEVSVKLSANLKRDPEAFARYMSNWRKAICIMIETWPKLAKFADLKQQTPLMLAANHGDIDIVEALLKCESNAIQQDLNGKTALHAAVAARSIVCVNALLRDYPTLTSFVSRGKQTVLHTAVRVIAPEIVLTLINQTPELKDMRNDDGITAFELAKNLGKLITKPADISDYQEFMALEKRKVGSFQDFNKVVKLLSK